MIRAQLHGRRLSLRPLVSSDFEVWKEVRRRNVDWLTKWEPRPPEGYPNDSVDRAAFSARCGAREREWQLGTGYGFGIFVSGLRGPNAAGGLRGPNAAGGLRGPNAAGGLRGPNAAVGQFSREMNLSGVQRGPFQNAYVGYWIDHAQAGNGYVPEALVVAARFAFEDLNLHRLQVAIIPRNAASRRVVEKLGLREEGIAERYLSINGAWEDHIRYAITVEEWADRRADLLRRWIEPEAHPMRRRR
ncbi:MAG: GNAT family N-acetyltransferase [Acidimicrobiales bacterium]